MISNICFCNFSSRATPGTPASVYIIRLILRSHFYTVSVHEFAVKYNLLRKLDIHVSVHHDIIYENDQQGATV